MRGILAGRPTSTIAPGLARVNTRAPRLNGRPDAGGPADSRAPVPGAALPQARAKRGAGSWLSCPAARLERDGARILIAAALIGLPVVLPGLLREGLASTAAIYLVAATLLVTTALAMSRASRADPLRIAGLPNWLLTRGLLYGLLEAPIFAVLAGYFFGYLSYPVAAFAVLVSAAVLPVWVAWRMPPFWSTLWPRLSNGVRRVTCLGLGCAVVVPFAFAAYQATAWQFPLQHRIDQATFGRDGLVTLGGAPQVTVDGQEARYVYSMQFGPRLYRTRAGATRALEADHLRVSGRVLQAGPTIAWCSTDVVRLEGPPASRDPLAYRSALEDSTSIPVTCVGPATSLDRLRQIALEWEVSTDLVGDREQVRRRFWGTEQTGSPVSRGAPGPQAACRSQCRQHEHCPC